jgi:hypothetical protein
MLAAIAAGLAFHSTGHSLDPTQRILWFGGGLLCQLRLFSSLFYGTTPAVRHEIYNEIPDRISDAAILIGLGYSYGGDVVLGFAAALTSVFVSYVRAMTASIGAPNEYYGPMARPQRTTLVTVLALYLAFSPETWRLPWSEVEMVLAIIIIGGLLTSVRRLIRADRYLA